MNKIIFWVFLILNIINISDQSCINIKAIDLTWPFDNSSIYWVNQTEFKFTKQVAENISDEYWYATNDFTASEHGGTHLDAPYHFYETGWKVGDIPLQRLIVPGVTIDVSKEVEKEGSSRNLLESDLIKWEQENGPIPCSSVVIIKFGWSQYYNDRDTYLGEQEDGKLNFPGVSPEAANWLANHKRITGIAVDVASVDPGNSEKFEAHRALAKVNMYILENVKITEDLPVKNFTLLVMPMKIAEGTGAPLRLVALLNEIKSEDEVSC